MVRLSTLLPAVALLAARAPSPAAGPAAPRYRAAEVATGLDRPTDLAFLPGGVMIIVEKGGAVKLRSPSGAVTDAGAFDVDSGSEKGLLGVVAHPEFATSRLLYFYVSASDRTGGTDLDRHRVVRVPLGTDGRLDEARARVIVSGLRGPRNHDGGALAIGPDGKLYVGVGDTGCNSGRRPEPPYPPTNYFATCLTHGNGKILRVNLDGSIPADNPLARVAAVTACGATCRDVPSGTAPPRRDVWAWGFRNPWRFAFDPLTGNLWVGDVGEVTIEEVTLVRAGRHHGWPWREGPAGWPVSRCRQTVPDTGDCVEPAYACRHGGPAGGLDGDCVSVTGGTFLTGEAWPTSERGRYLFADNVNGRVWTLELDAARQAVLPGSRREVLRLPGSPVSLRTGPDGLVYAALLSGRVMRISADP
jgi:glucose/arabinose dehydrogenase